MVAAKPSDLFIHAIKARRHEQELEADNIVRYTFDKLSTAFKFTGKSLDKPEWKHFKDDEEYIFDTIFSLGYCPLTFFNEYWEGVPGNMDGELGRQYDYTKVTYANPALNFYEQRTIGEDVWILQCDAMRIGLIPLISKYAYMMSYSEKSIEMADIMCRMSALITAPNDDTKKAADQWLTDLRNGKMTAVGDNAFFDGIKAQPLHSGNTQITDLIELRQYAKASLDNELGLNSNFNMKRESISKGESEQQDNLSALMDSILKSLKKSCKKFVEANPDEDLDVIYDPDGVWGRNERQSEAETEIMEAQVEQAENEADPEEVPEETTDEVTETPEEQPEEETPEETPEDEPEDTPEEQPEETPQEVTIDVNVNINTESEVKEDDDESTDEGNSESEDDT